MDWVGYVLKHQFLWIYPNFHKDLLITLSQIAESRSKKQTTPRQTDKQTIGHTDRRVEWFIEKLDL